jgi:hypothetical protein
LFFFNPLFDFFLFFIFILFPLFLYCTETRIVTTSSKERNSEEGDVCLVTWVLMVVTSCITVVSSKAVIHPSTRCASCGMTPIVGIRFRCANCALFDLCAECYEDEHEKVHNPLHLFLKIPKPLNPSQPLPAPGLICL